MSQETLQAFIEQIDTLTVDEQLQLMNYLQKKMQQQKGLSAEAKAILRLKDEEDESQWITVIQLTNELDETALNNWLSSHV